MDEQQNNENENFVDKQSSGENYVAEDGDTPMQAIMQKLKKRFPTANPNLQKDLALFFISAAVNNTKVETAFGYKNLGIGTIAIAPSSAMKSVQGGIVRDVIRNASEELRDQHNTIARDYETVISTRKGWDKKYPKSVINLMFPQSYSVEALSDLFEFQTRACIFQDECSTLLKELGEKEGYNSYKAEYLSQMIDGYIPGKATRESGSVGNKYCFFSYLGLTTDATYSLIDRKGFLSKQGALVRFFYEISDKTEELRTEQLFDGMNIENILNKSESRKQEEDKLKQMFINLYKASARGMELVPDSEANDFATKYFNSINEQIAVYETRKTDNDKAMAMYVKKDREKFVKLLSLKAIDREYSIIAKQLDKNESMILVSVLKADVEWAINEIQRFDRNYEELLKNIIQSSYKTTPSPVFTDEAWVAKVKEIMSNATDRLATTIEIRTAMGIKETSGSQKTKLSGILDGLVEDQDLIRIRGAPTILKLGKEVLARHGIKISEKGQLEHKVADIYIFPDSQFLKANNPNPSLPLKPS